MEKNKYLSGELVVVESHMKKLPTPVTSDGDPWHLHGDSPNHWVSLS
jgi:hypothetical protein